MTNDVSTAEKLRLLRALKEHSDEKKEEAEKEFEELKKKEEEKKKEQEALEKQIEELESELTKTEKDVIAEEKFISRAKETQEDDEEDEQLEEIAEKTEVSEEEQKAVQYKVNLEDFSKSQPDVYKVGSNNTYDQLRDFRNKLSSNTQLSYEENKLLGAMRESIEKVNLNQLENAEDVLDNIVASKYLLKQIDKYKQGGSTTPKYS